MSKWQPIESAPKDGAWILAVRGHYVPAVAKWDPERGSFEYTRPDDFAEEEHYREYVERTDPWEPTHWMPLPEPPK